MLTKEEELRLAAVLGVARFDMEKRVLGERGLIENITVGTILWLAEKLKETNDECSKVHLELQKANEELARVHEVFGP